MKRRNVTVLSTIFLCFALVLAACSSGSNPSTSAPTNKPATNDASPAPTEEAPKELEGTLEVWTFYEDGTKAYADEFMKKHPKVKINVTNPGWNELPQNLQNTIAAGNGAPDVAFIEGSMFSRFVDSDGLEDMLQPPYNAGQHKDSFVEDNWNRWLSLDGKRLLGMPLDMPPMVTFYRPDLIEQAGYPSDPAELQQLMSTKEGLLKLGEALKAQGVYLFEFDDTPLGLIQSKYGYFDRNLNYLRNNDEVATFFDLSRDVKQLGLAMNQSAAWSDEGKAMASTGKIAMLFYGVWYTGQIQSFSDDQIGKWDVTGLPLGLHLGQGGSTMVIPSQGKNKELAYAFVEWSLATMEGNELYISRGGMPGYTPSWDSPLFSAARYELFGDREVAPFFAALMSKIETTWLPNPLNDRAAEFWNDKLKEALEKNMDGKAALSIIEQDTLRALDPDIQRLKAEMGIQ